MTFDIEKLRRLHADASVDDDSFPECTCQGEGPMHELDCPWKEAACLRDSARFELGGELDECLPEILDAASSAVFWEETARQESRNTAFYRELLAQIASRLGHAAYVADDGSVMESPLYLRLPELVDRRLTAAQASEAYVKQLENAALTKIDEG